MNAILTLILAAIAVGIGYWVYAKSIDRGVIQPDPKKATPAKMYMDGVDFSPSSGNVLFGYQFKSIAALGPITGPIVAVQWGWLPALLWILLGVFFIGWVQDYGTMMMSVRKDGDTLGALSYKLVSPRARTILLIFIYFYLWLIMGAFGTLVGFKLMTNPRVPFGILSVILMGLLAGQMTYKWKKDIILTTVITVVVSLIGIWLGTLPAISNIVSAILGDPKAPPIFFAVNRPMLIGSLLVMAICYLGSVLPIWRWAQPINYVCFFIIALGMLAGIIGMIVWRPSFGDFPAFTTWSIGIGPLWPIMFVTIACGAISGWHSLVSTSGTARQLEKETDGLPVGGGAMFMEGVLAIISLLTATAAFGSWDAYKTALGEKAALGVFAEGLATFMSHVGVPMDFGVAFGSVFLTIMALTIMYLVVRFMRVASAEFIGDKFPAMKNVHVGTIVAIILTLILIWIVPWLKIWVAFGSSNQLMAGLSLMLLSLWLLSEGRRHTWALYPSIFMIVTTIAALVITSYNNFSAIPGKTVTATIASAIIGLVCAFLAVMAIILVSDGWRAFQKYRAGKA